MSKSEYSVKCYFLLLIPLLASGCAQKNDERLRMSISDSGRYENHCIGRYQFSLPAGFSLISGSVGEFHPRSMSREEPAINFELVATGVGSESYRSRVQKRIAELREEKKGSGVDYLADMKALGDDLTQLRAGSVEKFYRSEIHALKGDAYVIASLESSDDQYEAAEARLRDFVAGIVITDTPGDTGDGFCIGPLTINGDFDREWYEFSYRNPSSPDVVISADVDTFSKDDPETLFDRLDGSSSLLSIVHLNRSVIRKREIQVGGMHAQEWLGAVKLPEQKDRKYGFALETTRRTPSRMSPKIHVGFDSGEPGIDGVEHETSVSDKEAVTLWDRAVESIRPRKGAP